MAQPSPTNGRQIRVGMVGLGAIGSYVAEALNTDRYDSVRLVSVLVQTERSERPSSCPAEVLLTTDVEQFFSSDWDVCVEVAGQPWLKQHAARVLKVGRSLLVTSVGAFTDDALLQELTSLSESPSGGRLLIAAGAMPGIDWMSSAALEDIEELTLEQRKRPEGWLGTPAEAKVDLKSLQEATTIFEGPAREAAAQFPKNANVAATLALATVGLDQLKVRLVADPQASGPMSQIKLKGKAGEISIEVKGAALTQRTSRIVPLSVLKALRNLAASKVVGV